MDCKQEQLAKHSVCQSKINYSHHPPSHGMEDNEHKSNESCGLTNDNGDNIAPKSYA